jgi:hypothetical protein
MLIALSEVVDSIIVRKTDPSSMAATLYASDVHEVYFLIG